MKAKKLFDRKSVTVRVACALLSLIIFVGTLPLSVLAADADPIQNTGTGGSNISDFDLMNNDVTPDGFSTTTNPYGYGIGVPFLMVEQNELMVLRDYGNSNGIGHNDYWDFQSGSQMVNFVNAINKQYNGYDEFTASEYDLVQAVAFDPTGNGRNDHVAFVGLKQGKGYLWVIDTRISGKNGGDSSSAVVIGDFSTLFNDDNVSKLELDTYRTRSIVDIVAGDFDGDGKETIVVYTPQNLKNRRDKTTGAGLNDSDRGCVVQEWRYQTNGKSISKVGEGYTLLMDAYVKRHTVSPSSKDSANDYWIDKENEEHNVLRNKLGVSMTVDDFNGDGVDDLAVLSYSHKRYNENQPIAYYTPVVKVVYGQKNNASTITNRNAAQTFTFRTAHPKEDRYYQFPVAAELTSGDLDGDGDIDLFLAGLLGEIAEQQGNETYAYKNMTMYPSKFYVGRMTNNGGSFAQSLSGTVDANGWTYGGYYNDDHVYQKIAVEAVAINGHAAAEMVFVNGTLYDCSNDKPVVLNTTGDNYFGSKDDGAGSNTITNTTFNSIAVGNFDGNDAGREQVLFTLALNHKGTSGSHLAVGYLRGTSYADATSNGAITQYGKAGAYECEVDTDSYVDADAANHVNFLFIAVDRDYDGILAKYRGPEYAYTDPDVKAVLQAAPYFSDISDSGNNETEYRLIESYELSQSSSNEVSFSVGYVGEFGADEGPKVSIEAGYALDWTETFEKSLRTEYEASFSAQAYNSVVIYRIPVFIYCFDIQRTDGSWHNKTAMQTAIPQAPVYEQLSVDAYNEFVDVYNDYMAEWNDPDDYHKLYKIDTEANYLANNEGNPYGYYSNAGGWSVLPDGKPISKASTALGTNGGMNKVAWTEETAETHETTMSHGFYFSFTFTYGFPGQAHGVSTSLEYSHGKGRATTKGTAIGASCTVTDIDGPGLREEGVPQSVINSYGFNWALGQWTQHLSGEADNKTAFVGFNLTNIKSPAPAVQDLRAEAINDTTIELTWTKPDAAGWPDITGYYVYMLDDLGEYPAAPTSEKISPDATSYIVNGLDSNTEYTFVVVTVRNVDNQEIRSTWSNHAVAVTSKNLYTVTTESNMPKGMILSVKHLGNVNIASGEEIPEGSIVKITASPKTSAYAIKSVEIIENGKDPLVLVPDDSGNISYNFILGNHTVIRVNMEKLNVSAQVGYTDRYYDGETLIGSITATENGSAFASGSTASGDVEFTATPADGYALSAWDVIFDGQTTRVPADESNTFTLETVSGSYIVTAVFVPEAIDLLEALEEVRAKLQAAIDTKADADEVNDALEELQKAIDALEEAKDDYAAADATLKAELEAAIEIAKSDAISAAQILVDNAKAELQNAIDTKADEATVNAAIANLQNAISKLESAKDNYVSADAALKAELEAAIEEAKKEAIEASKGYIPHIGENGNWWIGDTDTGIQVAGKDGKDGADGKDGKDGLNGKDGKDGKDGINGTNGKDGVDGKDGQNGSDGRGIENATINEEGYLVLTMSDGTTINAGLVRDNSVAANAGVSEGESTTRTIATVAAVCSGISLLWNIISLVVVLIEKKKKIVNV